jgi:outer membrane autotransporter protein
VVILDSVNLTGSNGHVVGGYSFKGDVTNNRVELTNFNVSSASPDAIFGGYANDGDAKSNSVSIDSSEITSAYGGYTYGNGAAENNSLEVLNSGVSGSLYGGYSADGAADNNSLKVLNSQASDLYGGFSAFNGNASYNYLGVSNSNVTNLTGGYSRTGNATYNLVVLATGANVSGNVSGGLAGVAYDNFTGNTLRLDSYTPIDGAPIDVVQNFENYEFFLPASVTDGFVALQANTINLGPAATTSKVTRLEIMGGRPLLRAGDTITLLNATTVNGNFDVDTIESASMGFFFKYDFDVYQDTYDKSIKAMASSSARINPQAKAVTETSAARLAFVNQGQDFLTDQGIELARARSATENGLGVFLAFTGGKSRYDTGSHVDLAGFNTLLGVSMGNYFDQNRLTFGVFGELGFGNYDSYTPAGGEPALKAEGDVSYVGGGVFGRLDVQSSAGTAYVEASGRIGNSKAEFEAKNFRIGPHKATYKTSGTYLGAHAGVGYDLRVTEETDLDVFFKYLWTRQNGADERVLGANFTLDDADSSRIKTGARLKYNYNDFIKPYVGGAYIYEFDGETDARVYGINLPNADLKGSSALAEAGITLLNDDTIPISLDAGIQGHFGNRRGFSGSLDIKYEF